ncbi:Phosphotransferase enzyme [Pseudogymnoascus verrucosus]|uniref:Phosphotransferase enzyme n=1 Tax=Pseudogymnoascus verrucosus TaxID=342668 RepID=A0A1B8GXC5_9PEZI|nr:Phosphotransferase enzyme [Pseudogymnoascus verrucosus]OBU00470.1 Phosphotransferase enzyme [Pseudogymnoascus verrucosus]
MDDGFEVIVKIPYHLTVPKHFTTESEVATLDFLQSKGIPIPRVYAWSSKSDNAVGTEYIIMEKAPGQPLEDRVRLVTSYIELEIKLFSLRIDAFGSLYYKETLPPHLQADIYAADTPDESGDAKRFCVGPAADYMFWRGKRDGLELDRGPWRDPHAYLRAIGTKELELTRRFGKPLENEFPHGDMLEGKIAPEAYIELFDKYLALSSYLLPKSRDNLLNRPTLRHPDLNPTNIFVSDECEVSCIIDWQHTTVLPFLLAAGNPPIFENPDPTPPKDYVAPTLPENYASLNPDEKEYADELHRRRMLFYLYMIFNGKDNNDHFSAMRSPLLAQRQHLIDRAGMQWTGNTVTLQGALMRVVDGWGLLALEGHGGVECPVSFGAEESEAFYELEKNWFNANILVEH